MPRPRCPTPSRDQEEEGRPATPVPDAAANAVAAATAKDSIAPQVPSKSLLLYLVRMGSFTSAPKILNDDTQDDDLDIGDKCSVTSLLELCQDELATLPPLLQRTFVRLRPPLDSYDDMRVDNRPSFTVMQWNVLSQALGQQNDNFVACPDEALEWKTRRFRMLEEMLLYLPDVLCLQEVDHFNFLRKTLGSLGYNGIFFPKPDSPCIYIPGNNGPDGCALFFNMAKFECIKTETRVMEVWRVQSNQVAILAILRSRATGNHVCVVTTHLKARQGSLLSTLRNEQGKDLLEFVRTHYGGHPLVICGDFNAEPTEPVYATMLGNKQLGLASAYAALSNRREEPPYTTWKIREDGEVCHTLDYIFYSESGLEVEGLLHFPLGEDMGEGRVPSLQYPSDHFSLVSEFRIKQ